MSISCILPRHNLPNNIKVLSTTNRGGHSEDEFATFNLSDSVGDLLKNVNNNRELLVNGLSLPAQPYWLQQVHGNLAINHSEYSVGIQADAIVCNESHKVCAILTADCVPIVLVSHDRDEVAAIHAGWRGLYTGIIKNTLQRMNSNAVNVFAWIGPCISQKNYQVDADLREKFVRQNSMYESCFLSSGVEKYQANLSKIAKLQLQQGGVTQIEEASICTFAEPNLYSYRRDGKTGRFATIVYMV